MHISYKYINLVMMIRCIVNSNSNGHRYSSVSQFEMYWAEDGVEKTLVLVYLYTETISNSNPKPSTYSEQSNRMINHIVYL